MNTGALNLLSSACTTNMATVNTVENSTGNGSEGRSVSTNSTGFLSVIAQINQVAQMHEKESSNSDTDANGTIPEHEASTHSESVINPATNLSSCPPPVPNLSIPSRPPNRDVSPLTMPSTEASSTLEERRVSIHNIGFVETDNGLQLSIPMTTRQEAKHTFKESYNDGYNSNDELGPFFDAVAGEQFDFSDEEEEDSLVSTPVEPMANSNAPAESGSNYDTPAEPSAINNTLDTPAINEAAINLITVAQLKEELKKRKLSQSGVKTILQLKLLVALTSPTSQIISSVANRTEQLQVPVVPDFPPGATWKRADTRNLCCP